jgi:hypothetical protein
VPAKDAAENKFLFLVLAVFYSVPLIVHLWHPYIEALTGAWGLWMVILDILGGLTACLWAAFTCLWVAALSYILICLPVYFLGYGDL